MATADLLLRHGYALVALVALLEGESALLLAGATAAAGHLALPCVVAAAAAGSLAGDQACYWAGRRWGRRWLTQQPRWRSRLAPVLDRLARHQRWVLASFRFWYGLRALTPFAVGATGIPAGRCLVFNAMGALAWASTFGLAGYGIGAALAAVPSDAGSPMLLVIALLSALLVAVVVRRRRRVLDPDSTGSWSAGGMPVLRAPARPAKAPSADE